MVEEAARRERPARAALDWVVPIGAAVVVLAVTLLLAQRNRALTVANAEARDWEVVTDLVVALHLDLEASVDEVESAVVQQQVRPGPVGPSQVPGIALGVVTGGRAEAIGTDLTAEDLERPGIVGLLARAADTGRLASATPAPLDAGLRSLLAAPVYRSAAPPPSVEARRAALDGWVVATMDLGAMAAAHLPEGAGARVTVGERSFIGGAGPPHAEVGRQVELHGYVLDVRAGAVDRPGVRGPTWAILVVGSVAALSLAAWTLSLRRRNRHAALALRREEDQAQLIAEVAPVVQQSLDLADVLPAVAVQLRDHFGLAGVRLLAGSGPGGEVEVFGLGARPPEPPVPRLTPPEHLAAGESVGLALQRGGRSVARLELVAGRALHGEELRSLRVLTELVTAAVVNANLYASQQEAVGRLRDLDALKTVFLSTASHELRTPVTAITGFASLLVDGWDRFPEQQRQELVGRIAANARSLVAVVQDLLDFSLLDRREQPLPAEPIDLAVLAAGVVDRLSALFTEHTIDVQATPSPPVAGERNALERVITNLLTNAAKYSPEGTTITVAVGGDDARGWVVVSDQGPGVPEEERARIFTRFYRGSGEAEMRSRGVGIGLSVVAELVQRLGGAVEVGEAPGGGARFRVELPTWAAGDGALAPEREVEGAPTR